MKNNKVRNELDALYDAINNAPSVDLEKEIKIDVASSTEITPSRESALLDFDISIAFGFVKKLKRHLGYTKMFKPYIDQLEQETSEKKPCYVSIDNYDPKLCDDTITAIMKSKPYMDKARYA